MKETKIQNQIIRWARAQEGFWIAKVTGGFYGESGIPDLLLSVKGRFVALEVKRLDGNMSQWQERQQEKIRATGAICEVVRSLEEAQDAIRRALK